MSTQKRALLAVKVLIIGPGLCLAVTGILVV